MSRQQWFVVFEMMCAHQIVAWKTLKAFLKRLLRQGFSRERRAATVMVVAYFLWV
jgi:hypothetical protein